MLKFFRSFATPKVFNPRQVVYFLLPTLSIFIGSEIYASDQSTKPTWYRYYDKNGVANISSSVTPEHIRRGYESLDQNMQVIHANNAYSVEQDMQQAHARAKQAQQQEEDLKFKKAYGNSQIATKKRDELLQNINKQIEAQNIQLKKIQKERGLYKQQEMSYFRKGQDVPKDLKDRLSSNMQDINNIKLYIQSLQTDYRNTQIDYDKIINRLKALE